MTTKHPEVITTALLCPKQLREPDKAFQVDTQSPVAYAANLRKLCPLMN